MFADNFIPVLPVDAIVHTVERPFCSDPTCPCHENQENIAVVGQHVADGLFTPTEATDFVDGKLL